VGRLRTRGVAIRHEELPPVAAMLARYADSSPEEVRNDAGNVTARDDSGWPLAVPAGILGNSVPEKGVEPLT
jgi:hypothetical protein